MTTNHVYNIVVKAMNKLEDINFISLEQRKYNQTKVNLELIIEWKLYQKLQMNLEKQMKIINKNEF